MEKNNNDIVKVIHIVGKMDMGGQETFIMNLYRNIDRNKIQFDFIVHSKEKGYYDDEIEKLGGKIYRITPLSKNIFKHILELYKVLKVNNKYILHRHTCSSIIAIDLLVAKLAKIKKRIVHSHATKSSTHEVANKMFMFLMNKLATDKLACSNEAGKFLYGEKNLNKITILIPVYNEVDTLRIILEKVENADFCGLEKEIILIDDCSTDGTKDIYPSLPYKVLYHDVNQGKGAALRDGFKEATGDIIIIQDADLEYDPVDYKDLIQLILDNKADVAYGSRLNGGKPSRAFMFHHLLGNKLLTFVTNVLYNTTLTDMETCYKAFRADFIKDIEIKSNRFDFEPEITAKVLKKGARLYELSISYYGREFAEGKKITWKDGFHALWALIKFRFID